MNRLNDDPCAIGQKQENSTKKLKYVTTSFKDLVEGKETKNFFGIGIKDQLFVPSAQIDQSTTLRNSTMTNPNTKYADTQLPLPTLPYRGQLSRGDVDKEMILRGVEENRQKSCLPKGLDHHERSFYIFPNGIETPDALKSVEPWRRGGEGTRN